MVLDIRKTTGTQDVIITIANFPIEVGPTPLIVNYGTIFNEKRCPRRFFRLFQIICEYRRSIRQPFGRIPKNTTHRIIYRLAIIKYTRKNYVTGTTKNKTSIFFFFNFILIFITVINYTVVVVTSVGMVTRYHSGRARKSLIFWCVLLTIFRDYNIIVDKCNITVKRKFSNTLPNCERILPVRWRHHKTPGTCHFWGWPKTFELRIESRCAFNACKPSLVLNLLPGSRLELIYSWATYCCSTQKTRIWQGRISNKRYLCSLRSS